MESLLWRKVLLLGVGSLALLHCSPPPPVPADADAATQPDAAMTDSAPPMDTPIMMDASPVDTGGGMCGMPLGACNPTTSEGCSADQACYIAGRPDGGGPTGTCGTPGVVALGMPCASAGACQRGLQCLNSVCTRMCCAEGANEICRVGGGRAICVALRLNGVTQPLFNCENTSACDWFAQDCPTATDNCLPIRADGTTQCTAGGAGVADAPCGGSTGVTCGRGLICAMRGGASPTCRRICNPLAMGDAGVIADGGISMACPAGQTCGTFPAADYPQSFGACFAM